jgi:hypothetical protein
MGHSWTLMCVNFGCRFTAFRFDPEVYEALMVAAEKEGRSVTKMSEAMVLGYADHLMESGGGVPAAPVSSRKKGHSSKVDG